MNSLRQPFEIGANSINPTSTALRLITENYDALIGLGIALAAIAIIVLIIRQIFTVANTSLNQTLMAAVGILMFLSFLIFLGPVIFWVIDFEVGGYTGQIIGALS